MTSTTADAVVIHATMLSVCDRIAATLCYILALRHAFAFVFFEEISHGFLIKFTIQLFLSVAPLILIGKSRGFKVSIFWGSEIQNHLMIWEISVGIQHVAALSFSLAHLRVSRRILQRQNFARGLQRSDLLELVLPLLQFRIVSFMSKNKCYLLKLSLNINIVMLESQMERNVVRFEICIIHSASLS